MLFDCNCAKQDHNILTEVCYFLDDGHLTMRFPVLCKSLRFCLRSEAMGIVFFYYSDCYIKIYI